MTQKKDQVTAHVQLGGMINYIPCSVEVGEVTTLPAGSDATVTNSGDEHEIVLDFGLPKGDKGDQGETGETGKSAYEYAVEQGYEGSEEDFGESLATVNTKATQAASSATAAAASATSASGYSTSASNSATAAAGSAANAADSEQNAATSAASAQSHAVNAANSALLAGQAVTSANASASAAATQATNAATSATSAAQMASAAASSANTASGYASAAQSAASTATEKANTASQSATAAAASATSAGTSADNAAASALSASTSATAAQDALAEVRNYRRIDRTYIAGTPIDDYTGSLTVFDLGLDFDLADYVVDVLVNGKGYQGVKAPVDFTVSGDVVTFVEAVPVGAVVQFRINASTTVIIAGSVDVDAKIAEHNISTTAHSDIRTVLTTHTGDANIHVTSSDKSNWNAKQAALSTAQITATNSGITAAKVSSYDTHVADTDIHVTVSDKSTWNGKQSALSTAQLSATNSGITSAKVSGYDTHVANSDIHVTAAQKTAWTGKQDTISDLTTIRSGAALGATAVQKSGDTMTGDLTMAKNGTTVSGVRFLDENNTGYRIYSAKDGSNNKQLRMFEATSGGGGLFLNGSNGNRPYYFDGSSNSYRLLDVSDKTSLETSISTKANTDLSNVPSSKGILTESYVNGTSWYRVYSDGWCEQGGFSTGTGNANQVQTITFLKNFADTNFYFNGAQFAGSINANYLNFITESGRNVSDITLLGSVNRYWQACGYIS